MWGLFIPALIGALASAMGSFVGRAMIALGIGFVTYKGIDLAVDVFKQKAVDGITALPADVVSFLGYLWIDKALTIIFSSIVTALAIKGLSGSIKQVVAK